LDVCLVEKPGSGDEFAVTLLHIPLPDSHFRGEFPENGAKQVDDRRVGIPEQIVDLFLGRKFPAMEGNLNARESEAVATKHHRT
jgi:hypothetical protein